jgi:GNAT superfamily N-acetyltransferase
MSDPTLVLAQVDPAEPEAAALIAALDAELYDLYPDEVIHGIEPHEFRRAGGVFLVGRVGAVAVACGAIRPLTDRVVEVKRMFVRKDQRGRGYARALLTELERVAVRHRYEVICLETGVKQPEAIHLYLTAGYHAIEGCGEYSGSLTSRCFEKSLVTPAV